MLYDCDAINSLVKALAYELSRSSKEIVRTVGQFYLQEVH